MDKPLVIIEIIYIAINLVGICDFQICRGSELQAVFAYTFIKQIKIPNIRQDRL